MDEILEGKSALFVSVPNLVIELKEALSDHQLNAYKRKFEKYNLVILDELGYVSFDKAGSEILFNLLSTRISGPFFNRSVARISVDKYMPTA